MANTPDKKEPLRIHAKNPLTFESIMNSTFISPNDLCKKINGLFKSVLQDYVGCSINYNSMPQANGNMQFVNPDGVCADVPMNAFYLTIFFKDRGEAPDGMFKTLKTIGNGVSTTPGKLGLAASFDNYVELRSNPRQYSVTNETKEILEDMMYQPHTAKLNNDYWMGHIFEYQEQTGYYSPMEKPVVHVKIAGLDLNKVVTKLFSTWDNDTKRYVDANNDPVEYQIIPFIPPMFTGVQKNVIFQINKLDVKTLRNLVDGMYSGTIMNNYYVSVQ